MTVALNAQVNPANPGGAESAIRGMLRHFAQHAEPSERIVALATRRYASDVEQWTSAGQRVVAWPFQQPAYAPFRSLSRRWQRARRRAGPLGPGIDLAHRVWWSALQKLTRPPSAADADRVLRAHGVDLVHFPYAVHFPTTLPFVYEPLDLQHRHLPNFFSPGEVAWRDGVYRSGCERARLIVTGTRWTKQDIVGEYGIDPRKIAVISIQSDMQASGSGDGAGDAARLVRTYALPERFLLYPAMTFPHKNHVRLFKALAILRDRHGVTLTLVCTGRPYEPHEPALRAAIERLGVQGQVRMLGAVPTDDLIALYRAAWVLVFPSLFEGIGMPVLEALQYDLPVLTSNATCLPEVAGDAALYFDPTRADAIADAILTAERNPALLEQHRSVAPAVLARFSWPEAARTYLACYRAVAGLPLTAEQRHRFEEAIAR